MIQRFHYNLHSSVLLLAMGVQKIIMRSLLLVFVARSFLYRSLPHMTVCSTVQQNLTHWPPSFDHLRRVTTDYCRCVAPPAWKQSAPHSDVSLFPRKTRMRPTVSVGPLPLWN